MIYDPVRRVYIENGRVLTPAEVRQHIEDFIDSEQKQVETESKKVLAVTLALAVFFSFLRDRIRYWHSVTGVVAYGGQSQMNLERWKRINEKVQSELGFLDKFQVDAEKGLVATRNLAAQAASAVEANDAVPSGLEAVVQREVHAALLTDAASRPTAVREAVKTALADSIPTETAETVATEVAKDLVESTRMSELIWGQVESRSRMYTDAAYSTYINSEKDRESDLGAIGVRRVCEEDDASCDDCVAAATDEYVGMDEIADIGTLTCLNNCRCYYEFELFNVEPLTIDREIYA